MPVLLTSCGLCSRLSDMLHRYYSWMKLPGVIPADDTLCDPDGSKLLYEASQVWYIESIVVPSPMPCSMPHVQVTHTYVPDDVSMLCSRLIKSWSRFPRCGMSSSRSRATRRSFPGFQTGYLRGHDAQHSHTAVSVVGIAQRRSK